MVVIDVGDDRDGWREFQKRTIGFVGLGNMGMPISLRLVKAGHRVIGCDTRQDVRAQFPDVVILAHPECSPAVVVASDFSGSTTAMIKYVERTHAPRYLLLTECSMGDNIVAANPGKEMLRLCTVRCPHMNEITLEDTLAALKLNRYVIDVPEPIRVRAARAVERMIAIGPKD